MDKAGKQYWDEVWEGQELPSPVDPRLGTLDNYVNRGFHRLFTRVFSRGNPHVQSLLEIGCARSRWLPYFATEFGFNVSGIDYSETGCSQAVSILNRAGVEGRVACANFFSPPPDMVGAFDVVVSFGVVEHFEDTAACLSSFAAFLKPGGVMITVIPNLAGIIGAIQKRLGRTIYVVHVPMDKRTLRGAHQRAGLSVQTCGYFLGINWGVLNFSDWRNYYLRWIARGLQSFASRFFWLLERMGLRIRPNRLTSPYIVCLAQARPVGRAAVRGLGQTGGQIE